jgi:hypothetical protein
MSLCLMKMMNNTLYVLKVVLDASPFDECALALRDQVIQAWCQSVCQYFGEELGDIVHDTDRSVVSNGLCSFFFRNEYYVS